MRIFSLLLIFLHGSNGKLPDIEKIEFCENLDCDEDIDRKVCGVKFGEDFSYRVFDNECQVLRHGCQVDESEVFSAGYALGGKFRPTFPAQQTLSDLNIYLIGATDVLTGCKIKIDELKRGFYNTEGVKSIDITYGIINMEFCGGPTIISTSDPIENVQFINHCPDCSLANDQPVCGIRQDGQGFRIRTFENECELTKHNCKKGTHFIVTDFFLCNDGKSETNNNNVIDEVEPIATEIPKIKTIDKIKPLIVIDGSMIDKHNINESIDNFFAATHILNLPVYEHYMNDSTRKKFIPIIGPKKIFKPWSQPPKNVSEDFLHTPLLASCFHKCPKKCPETYAPVCGMAGIVSKEPAIMFQNHCYMDIAQCKMYVEDKSSTATSSAYVESGFVFCLGDQLGQVYRFMPLVRTLQHMGRVRKKGRFKYKIRNLKFLNNLLRHPGDEKLMG